MVSVFAEFSFLRSMTQEKRDHHLDARGERQSNNFFHFSSHDKSLLNSNLLQAPVSFYLITIIKCFYSWFHEREGERAVSPSAVFARNIQNLVLLVFKIVSVLIFNGKFPFDIHSLCWPRKNMDDTQSRGFISIKMEISLWYLVCCEKMFLGWKQDESQWHWRLGLLNLPLFLSWTLRVQEKGTTKETRKR